MEPKAINAHNNSATLATSGQSKWFYPETRQQAVSYLDEGVRISLTKSMARNLVNFLQSLGADKELPNSKPELVSWLNHFHMQLAVNNPLWPLTMSFEFVYAQFVNAVMYNRVSLKGHNVHAFITAFGEWITSAGVLDHLETRWSPKPEIKSLPTGDIDGPVESWPDEVIARQYSHIIRMYEQISQIPMIRDQGGSDYFHRIEAEVKKRGL